MDEQKNIVEYLKNRGININLASRAKRYMGYCKGDKIAVSKNADKDRVLPILFHEFAHKIHSEIEPEKFKKGGTLNKIFNTTETKQLESELIRLTHFVDENSLCLELEKMKNEYKEKVKKREEILKQKYPDFKKSQKFVEYEKYAKKTKCKSKYLLKHDCVKFISPILRREEIYSIENLDKDFPNMNEDFKTYIRLMSDYRKQKRIQNRISKLKKYYATPTELFARFVEGLIIDINTTKRIAPTAFNHFKLCVNMGYYKDLKIVLNMARITI